MLLRAIGFGLLGASLPQFINPAAPVWVPIGLLAGGLAVVLYTQPRSET